MQIKISLLKINLFANKVDEKFARQNTDKKDIQTETDKARENGGVTNQEKEEEAEMLEGM